MKCKLWELWPEVCAKKLRLQIAMPGLPDFSAKLHVPPPPMPTTMLLVLNCAFRIVIQHFMGKQGGIFREFYIKAN